MRVGLISDIHGNVYALDRVLEALAGHGVDLIVCNGDVAWGFVTPAAAVDRVRERGIACVRGNCDDFPGRPAMFQEDADSRQAWEWFMGEIGDERAAWLVGLPLRRTDVGGEVLQFHGAPTDNTTPMIEAVNYKGEKRSPEEQAALLEGHSGAVVTFGHTHRPSAHRLGDRLLVNPGAVSNQVSTGDPRARYAVLEGEPGRWEATLHAVAYDVERAARVAEGLNLPQSAQQAYQLRHGRLAE